MNLLTFIMQTTSRLLFALALLAVLPAAIDGILEDLRSGSLTWTPGPA